MANRMPAVFIGHGSPMLALANTDVEKHMSPQAREINACYADGKATAELREMGKRLIANGKPKAILAISSHWYTPGIRVQTAEQPRTEYDMYGFPEELYQVQYPAPGCPELGKKILEIEGLDVIEDNSWGIDHGVWSVLVHMLPEADIPIVEMNVGQGMQPAQMYEIGKKLSSLRDEGYMILASGNIVHNLGRTEWFNMQGTPQADSFSNAIRDMVLLRDDEGIMNYQAIDFASYAVPTPDHFDPLFYILGATIGDQATVFNDVRNLGSMSMTSFAFGL